MFSQYFKQAFYLLKDNKLLSAISIIGTALAITMIMCIILIARTRMANIEPEVHRDRTLSVQMVIGQNINDNGWNNGGYLSLRVIKECFYTLTTAEAVTAITTVTRLAASPDNTTDVKCTVKTTDDTFWKIFRFDFLSGAPYGEEYISGEKKAVVTRSLARAVFGTEDVVGHTLSLGFIDYTVCGVVADVSVLAENTYAEVWVPYPSLADYESNYTDGLLGQYYCHILAPSRQAIDEVRAEAQANVDRMNSEQAEFKLLLSGAPDTQLMSMVREGFFDEPNVSKFVITLILVIVILLLVPAINLSGITLSRMRKRMEEIGVRRSFGATRGELMWQVLTENFLITLMGGVVGLVLSYFSVLTLREWLLNTSMSGYYGVETTVNAGMVVSLDIFVYALIFCLLLNLLSAGIPAWRVSRANIVNALNAN